MGSLNGKRGQDRDADIVVPGRPRAMPHVWESMERAPHLGRLTLVCFGPPTVRLEGREARPEVLWRKNLALLIYLARAPQHRRSRSQVLRVLWPDKDESRARHSLNESVHRLRSSLGQARLESQGDFIALSEPGLEVDALRLAALARNKLADALQIVPGDSPEGFTVEDAPEFEDWVSTERAGLHAKAAAVLVTLGEALLVEGRSSFADAREAARRALALDRYAEPAVRLAMRAAALAGDQAGALKAHHDFVLALREIGEHPSREFAALADRIRSDRWRPSGPTARADEPPLVGRATEWACVARALAEGLSSGPCTVAITGDPGAGKTRLLSHSLERLGLEGALVVAAR